MFNIDSIVQNVIGLPEKFYQFGNKLSMSDLLKQTNYLDVKDQIEDIDVQKSLLEHPEHINHWLVWSDNKRNSSGWFFEKNSYGQYVVGYLDSKMGRINEQNFPNNISACSYFIIKELQDI